MGKTSEGPPEVSFSDENSCTIRKKVALLLAFLAVASCVIVGLLVYYIGVAGNAGACFNNGQLVSSGDGSSADQSDQTSKVNKVKKITQVYCTDRTFF